MLEWGQRKNWMVASKLQKKPLLFATNAIAATAIFFFGQSYWPTLVESIDGVADRLQQVTTRE